MQLHVVVRGQVQGVGFRWFVREVARRRDMAGWVRNLADGTVEVAVDGDDESVATLRNALHDGPPGAVVAAVDDVAPIDGQLPHPFAILR